MAAAVWGVGASTLLVVRSGFDAGPVRARVGLDGVGPIFAHALVLKFEKYFASGLVVTRAWPIYVAMLMTHAPGSHPP